MWNFLALTRGTSLGRYHMKQAHCGTHTGLVRERKARRGETRERRARERRLWLHVRTHTNHYSRWGHMLHFQSSFFLHLLGVFLSRPLTLVIRADILLAVFAATAAPPSHGGAAMEEQLQHAMEDVRRRRRQRDVDVSLVARAAAVAAAPSSSLVRRRLRAAV